MTKKAHNKINGFKESKFKNLFFLAIFFSFYEIVDAFTQYKEKNVFLPLIVVLIVVLIEFLFFFTLVFKHYVEDNSKVSELIAFFCMGHSIVFVLLFSWGISDNVKNRLIILTFLLSILVFEIFIVRFLKKRFIFNKVDKTRLSKNNLLLISVFLVVFLLITRLIDSETRVKFAPIIISFCLVPLYASIRTNNYKQSDDGSMIEP